MANLEGPSTCALTDLLIAKLAFLQTYKIRTFPSKWTVIQNCVSRLYIKNINHPEIE
jgi:hypothetical protein